MTTSTQLTPSMVSSTASGANGQGDSRVSSRIAHLTRVPKTPTSGRALEHPADAARDQNWSHEEHLAAVLERQFADRTYAGAVTGSRTATFRRSSPWRTSTSTTSEVGYIPFDADAANLFFQLIASRYEQGAVMARRDLLAMDRKSDGRPRPRINRKASPGGQFQAAVDRRYRDEMFAP